MNRGALQAQTYQLPVATPMQQAAQPQHYQDEIGDPASGLEYIDGVTGDYFDKWAALKGFARDVQENYGIDVRYPDPSVPESTRLHKIYLKSIADLKKQGEILKTSQTMKTAALSRGDIMGQNVGQQPFATLGGNDVVDRDLDPIVNEANNKLQQLYFGNAVDEAKQYHAEIKSRLEDLRDSNPNQQTYWQRQIDALTPPTKAVKQFAPKSDTNNGRVNASGNFLKKVANLMEGTSEGYKLSNETFGPNGERVYVNKDLAGITYGGKPVSEWQYIPSTHETFIVAGGQKVPLSGSDAVSVAKGIVTENPRFGAEGQYIDQYADKNGYFTAQGEVNPDVLVDKQYKDTLKARREEEEAGVDAQADEAALSEMKSQLQKMEPSFWGDDRFNGIDKEGKQVKVAVRDEDDKHVYEIENIKDLIGRVDAKGKKIDYTPFKKMSLDQVTKFLAKRQVHLQFKKQNGTNTAPSNSTDRSKVL
jgi:hypothetical protein